ncbi:MAG TPA: hypothetical protein DDY20_02870 [Desulfobulbaceae bacterium]|nr:hypothetical protein [Desulfobulbaceae bacterium]
MASRQNNSDKKKIIRQLLLIAFLMLIGMTMYEALKQVVYPDITVWQSHIVTIIFSTVCATAASFYILRKQNMLNSRLTSINIESERLKKELENTIEQLETTLSEVKTLTGLLPICASCKKIRDDKGYWNQIESYIKERSEVDFSHSICPECVDKLYSEYDIYKKKKGT